jgi:hypothetical protein
MKQIKQKTYFSDMLTFDSRGHLKPYGIIPATVAELKVQLVDEFTSTTRKDNFDKYVKYSDDLKSILKSGKLKQWVNGSFVTKKTNPKDIDLVTFVNHALLKQHGNSLDKFKADGSWTNYGVDAYIVEVHPVDSKQNIFTAYDTQEWLDLFMHSRLNRKGIKHPKGFLEIFY